MISLSRGRRKRGKNGCSADQRYFLALRSVNNAAPPCFCATRFATRTASSIAIGASSRTNVWRAAVEACTASGRDQRLAGTGVAALHRGVGRSRGSTEDAVSVSRRSRRGPSSHNPQNSISVCQSRPLRARREASIASTAPTLPAQMAAIRRSTPAAGAAEIVVNELDHGPAECASAIGEAILATATLMVVQELVGR